MGGPSNIVQHSAMVTKPTALVKREAPTRSMRVSKKHGTNHAKGQAEKDGVNDEPRVARSQWAQKMASAVESNGEAEEVLNPWPHPLAVCNDASGRPGNHIHNSKN